MSRREEKPIWEFLRLPECTPMESIADLIMEHNDRMSISNRDHYAVENKVKDDKRD